jgi:hypothetical protein
MQVIETPVPKRLTVAEPGPAALRAKGSTS